VLAPPRCLTLGFHRRLPCGKPQTSRNKSPVIEPYCDRYILPVLRTVTWDMIVLLKYHVFTSSRRGFNTVKGIDSPGLQYGPSVFCPTYRVSHETKESVGPQTHHPSELVREPPLRRSTRSKCGEMRISHLSYLGASASRHTSCVALPNRLANSIQFLSKKHKVKASSAPDRRQKPWLSPGNATRGRLHSTHLYVEPGFGLNLLSLLNPKRTRARC